MPKKVNTQDFIDRSKIRHGNIYNYTKTNYIGYSSKIIIICKVHGEFLQNPGDHLKGAGCPECKKISISKNNTYTAKMFLHKAHQIFKNRYVYTDCNYISSSIKINIICRIHGTFSQLPNAHLYGQGCPKCGSISKNRSNSIKAPAFYHKMKILYPDILFNIKDYVDYTTKINFRCPKHFHSYYQSPKNALKINGCPKCKSDLIKSKLSSNNIDFIKKASLYHNDKYNYTNIKYVNNITPIDIVCPYHSNFWQTPMSHLKSGCPGCSNNTFKITEPAILYYIFDPESNMYKIGITNNSLDQRFGKKFLIDRSIQILQELEYKKGLEALEAEHEILEAFSYARCVNDTWPEKLGGKTEFFNEDILNLKDINDYRM